MARDSSTSLGMTKEVGQSGLVAYAGNVTETYTSQLYWPDAYAVYDEMRRRDPTIRTIWNALILLARTATWYFEPVENTDEDKRAAEFLQSCIEDMSHTIEDAIEDALSCVLFGWSWQELCYKRRDDGQVGWKKWAVRRQSAFDHWDFDKAGGVQAMIQRPAPDYEPIEIPIKKSLHFTSQRDGGNPEGFALLESLYEIWYYLKNYQIIQGIGWQRTFVGLPVFEFEEAPSAADRAETQRVGEGLTMDEKQFVSAPKGVKFRLESTSNSGAEALLNTIRHYRLLMLQTLLADFIDLGTGQTGSWALGSDKSQLFLMGVDGYLDRNATVINRFGVPRLLEYNPPYGEPTYLGGRANLVHTKVEKPALGQLGVWLQQVSGLLQWTSEDENWLRQRSGMPTVSGSALPSDSPPFGPEGESEELAELAEEGRDGERGEIEAALAQKIAQFLREQRARVTDEVGGDRNPGEDDAFWTQEAETFKASFLQQLLQAVMKLVEMVIEDTTSSFGGGADWAMVNADAAAWAREYVGELITRVTDTTRRAVRETVATWIETGAELRDLVRALAGTFGRARAELIASTEVTRAFDEANDLVRQRVGLPATAFKAPAHPACRCYTRPVLLRGGEWVVVWSTVRDDRVCKQPIKVPWGERVNGCKALHGVVVSKGEWLGKRLADVKRQT